MRTSNEGNVGLALDSSTLVSVIVPAYNAARTIDETLRSVRRQTHRRLEILVIDDGSTDGTADYASKHQAQDARIRVVQQSNGGVAAARNRGVRESIGELVAFVDADDLWLPTKIERQLQVMAQQSEEVGLVYTWFASIDENGRLLSRGRPGPTASGWVLEPLLRVNLPGNGSTPLMRKRAVLEAGGFDESFHRLGIQGCEDLKLYLTIAQANRFACVPEFLTGYRFGPSNMSGDSRRMLASFDAAVAPILDRHPHLEHAAHAGRITLITWLLLRSIASNRWAETAFTLRAFYAQDRSAAASRLIRLPYNWVVIQTVAFARRLRDHTDGTARRFLRDATSPQLDALRI